MVRLDFDDAAAPAEPQQQDTEEEARLHDTGISSSAPGRHGRGRRHIEEQDHLAAEDGMPADWWECQASCGRRPLPPRNELQAGLVPRDDETTAPARQRPEEVKRSLREVLTRVHGVLVGDEPRWTEAVMEKHGTRWSIQAMTQQGHLISREGATVHAVAEKLSMAPLVELRHFGLRFGDRGAGGCGGDGARAAAAATPPRRAWGLAAEDNPTFSSPGMHLALGKEEDRVQGCVDLSCSRREPEQMSRRYIRSGKDHWESHEVVSHGSVGDAGDLAFRDGLARCIGHGRRQFASRHIVGIAATP